MNAVAKAMVAENVLARSLPFRIYLPELKMLILVFLLLLSALGVVYAKDLNRRLFITYQSLQKQTEQLYSDGNKLLLEQSAWGAQARVQLLAQKQLQMQIPESQDVNMIRL